MSRLRNRVQIATALLSVGALLACGEDVTGEGAATPPPDAAGPDADATLGATDTVTPDVPPDVVTVDVPPDVPPDVQTGDGDATEGDASEIDTVDTKDVSACPGGPNCDCKTNGECDAGKCIETPDGKKCAAKCTDNCPAGYACKTVEAGDPSSYCVPLLLAVCSPCGTNKDCQIQGATDTLCISYGDQGKFCGGACTKDDDCPGKDYGCLDVTDEGTGKVSKQCKLKTKPGTGADCSKDAKVCGQGEVCDAGKCAVQPVCACSNWAKASGLKTTCSATGEGTTCTADRTCGPDGLSACTAKVVKCSKKGFKEGGSGKACTTNADCTEAGEQCNLGAAGGAKCAVLIGECVGKPACGAVANCEKIDDPIAETCDAKDNDCDGSTDEDFTWKSPVDGAELKWGASCGVGPCAGGTVICNGTAAAICNKASKAAAEACDGEDNDCNGKVDDATCVDKDTNGKDNPCTDNVCDAASKKCSNPPNAAVCDDENACTNEDKCDGKGACIGKAKDCSDNKQCTKDECDPKSGTCSNPNLVGSCDDGDACTIGDLCGDNKGSYECLKGNDKPKCDDNNVCTTDSCNPLKGCENKANAEASPCYSGDEKTKGVGECKAGVKKCDPATGKLGDKCEGEVVPNKSEACDGKDDTCDGKTDEGCKPTSVAITFSSAYVSGKSGDKQLQMLVGPSGPVGKAKGTGKYEIDFGFLAWLKALLGVK